MLTSKIRLRDRASVAALGPAALGGADEKNSRLAQAKLFAEIARRTESPFDAFPVGDASMAAVVLWREAAFWALAALSDEPSAAEGVRAVLGGVPPDLVVDAAGGPEWIPVVERSLLNARVPGDEPASSRRQAATLSAFTRRLIEHLDAPRRESEAQILRRLVRIAGAVGLALALGAFVWSRRGANLAARATVSTSSEYAACRDSAACGNAFFHTKEDEQPWIMYDLGMDREIRRVEVENRTDCCYERAVPLVVETSSDGSTWSERARTERAFSTWSADFRAVARYVRLRVARQSYLHLRSVVIR